MYTGRLNKPSVFFTASPYQRISNGLLDFIPQEAVSFHLPVRSQQHDERYAI